MEMSGSWGLFGTGSLGREGEIRLPCFLDGSFEDVARGVDEDVEAADAGVQGGDGRGEGFKVVGDV